MVSSIPRYRCSLTFLTVVAYGGILRSDYNVVLPRNSMEPDAGLVLARSVMSSYVIGRIAHRFVGQTLSPERDGNADSLRVQRIRKQAGINEICWSRIESKPHDYRFAVEFM